MQRFPFRWFIIISTIGLISFLGTSLIKAQGVITTRPQIECCLIPECAFKAQEFANSFIRLTENMGDAPSGQELTRTRLQMLKNENPEVCREFISLVKKYKNWEHRNHMAATCFAGPTMLVSENCVDWVDNARSLFTESTFRSSQFCREFRFLLEAGVGVADVGQSTESFYSSIRGLVSYTFAPHDPAAESNNHLQHCNGRIRMVAGLSQSYISKVGVLQGLLRLEGRLSDIHTMVGPIGNIKFLLQGGYGITRDIHSIGGGVGLEIEYGGAHVIYERISGKAKSAIQLNFTYRL